MYIGTTNPGKVREIGGICLPLDIPLIPISADIPEEGCTFEENAMSKALGYSALVPNEYVIVEDSGIVIPALNNLPGPWAAYFDDLDIEKRVVNYSGRPREVIDPANNKRVLQLMEDVEDNKRGAYFIISLKIMKNSWLIFQTMQKAHGWILKEPKGTKGFGYDPIFASDTSFGKSWAEIDSGRKNLISHRAKALWDLQAWLCSEMGRDIK